MSKLKSFLLGNTSTRQIILKNTFWTGSSAIIVKVIRVAVIIYAARLLGTDGYGIFTYAMSVALLFNTFADIGLSSILTRELAKNQENKGSYLPTALFIKLLFSVAVGICITVIGPAVSSFEMASALMPLLALSLVFEGLRNFLYAVPRSENKMEVEAVTGIVSELICTALVLVLFLPSPSPKSLVTAYMIGNSVSFLLTVIAVRKYINNIISRVRKSLVVPIIRTSFPFAIMGMFGIFMTNIDSVIIGRFTDEHALGLYGAAQRPIGLLYIIPSLISASFFSIISKLVAHGKDRVRTVAQKIYQASMLIALPVVAGGILVARPFINVMYGYDFIGAVLTFQILLTALLFSFPGSMFADVLLAENRQSVFILSGLIGAVANVALDFLLIPRYGIAGSAIATVFVQLVVNVFVYKALSRQHKIMLTRGLAKPLLATGAMSLAVWALLLVSIPLVVIVLAGVAIYAAVLMMLNEEIVMDIKKALKPAQEPRTDL